jgi:hypothetical protein
MKTIGFFGDSFCAGREPESWVVLLAKRLDAKIVNYGEPGKSIWTTFFRFNSRIKQDIVPDFSIFCWTEPYRLYHPKLILSANTEPFKSADPKVYKALDDYWKYLHNYDKDEMSYEYSLRYYDKDVLSKIDKEIVQMWSFRPFETAGKDAGIKLTAGKFIDESMFAFSKSAGEKDGWGVGTVNHMTTEQNQIWADKVYDKITS